jgi:hypothetical protein
LPGPIVARARAVSFGRRKGDEDAVGLACQLRHQRHLRGDQHRRFFPRPWAQEWRRFHFGHVFAHERVGSVVAHPVTVDKFLMADADSEDEAVLEQAGQGARGVDCGCRLALPHVGDA